MAARVAALACCCERLPWGSQWSCQVVNLQLEHTFCAFKEAAPAAVNPWPRAPQLFANGCSCTGAAWSKAACLAHLLRTDGGGGLARHFALACAMKQHVSSLAVSSPGESPTTRACKGASKPQSAKIGCLQKKKRSLIPEGTRPHTHKEEPSPSCVLIPPAEPRLDSGPPPYHCLHRPPSGSPPPVLLCSPYLPALAIPRHSLRALRIRSDPAQQAGGAGSFRHWRRGYSVGPSEALPCTPTCAAARTGCTTLPPG